MENNPFRDNKCMYFLKYGTFLEKEIVLIEENPCREYPYRE